MQELVIWVLGVVCVIETIILVVIALINYRRRAAIDTAITTLNNTCNKVERGADANMLAASWLVELANNVVLRAKINKVLMEMDPDTVFEMNNVMHHNTSILNSTFSVTVDKNVDENGDQMMPLEDINRNMFLGNK